MYLERQGFTILARNWRNRWCEIDIVTQRGEEVHVVEVKYRRHHSYGGGLGAINQKKLERLQRAAQAWAGTNRYQGPLLITALAVSGSPDHYNFELSLT